MEELIVQLAEKLTQSQWRRYAKKKKDESRRLQEATFGGFAKKKLQEDFENKFQEDSQMELLGEAQ